MPSDPAFGYLLCFVRSVNYDAVRRILSEFESLDDLCGMNRDRLIQIPCVGRRSVRALQYALRRIGCSLAPPPRTRLRRRQSVAIDNAVSVHFAYGPRIRKAKTAKLWDGM